jgi:hypothetical protein
MARRVLLVLGFAALAGCADLLPRSRAVSLETWGSYEEAKAAIDRIKPFETRRSELAAQGLEPYVNPAIEILTYSDILQRFAVGGKLDELELGIRECLAAGKACTGYQILVQRRYRDRIGGFWADSFNFRREVDITGWSFRALLLFVDDLVVYTLYGGQPRIHEQEITRNPLGPLQGWGNAIGPALIQP